MSDDTKSQLDLALEEELAKICATVGPDGVTVTHLIDILSKFDGELPVCLMVSEDKERELTNYNTVGSVFVVDGHDKDENPRKILVIE